MTTLLTEAAALVDRGMADHLDGLAVPAQAEALRSVLRYGALGPGKRVRPALVLGAVRALGGDDQDALAPACAVEFVHAYSLIHDDLPAMDDDAVRRGRPSCHAAHGEWQAILAGDALLTEGLRLAGSGQVGTAAATARPDQRLQAMLALAHAAGAEGMVGGQFADMGQGAGNSAKIDDLVAIHRHKTGALFCACFEMAGHYMDAPAERICALKASGAAFGLAFQLVDDLEDADGLMPLSGRASLQRQAEDALRAYQDTVCAWCEADAAPPLLSLGDALAARIPRDAPRQATP